jgi:DnaJ-class molecular chaperone
MKYHPDKNQNSPDANNKTQQINEAYETLSNDSKRQEYDFLQKNPFTKMNNININTNNDSMDEIFNMFFGGMPGGNMFGPNVHVFQTGFPGAVHGGGGFNPMRGGFNQGLQKPTPIVKNISINMEQVLSGTTVPVEIERWFVENNNKVFENETIYVKIPQGIDDGEMIIVREKGNIINDVIKGDIKID